MWKEGASAECQARKVNLPPFERERKRSKNKKKEGGRQGGKATKSGRLGPCCFFPHQGLGDRHGGFRAFDSA